MTIQAGESKFQEFQAQTKRNQIAQLDRMINEFEQMIMVMEEQIAEEEHLNGDNQRKNFTHANFAKIVRQRRDNLCQSLDDLKKQRENAAAVLAEIEAMHQIIRMRKSSFRQEHASTRAIMV